jgi:hypothetical protein
MPRKRTILFALALLFLGLFTTISLVALCAILVPVPGEIYVAGTSPLAPIAIFTPSPNQLPYSNTREYVEPHIAASVAPQQPPLAPIFRNTDPSVYATIWRQFGSVYIDSGAINKFIPRHSDELPINQVIPSEMRAHAFPWLTGDATFPAEDAERQTGARGWPLLAFWCEFRPVSRNTSLPAPPWTGSPTLVGHVGEPIGGIELPWPKVAPGFREPYPPLSTLPYRPLWRGLILDTLFFAALWWLLFAAPGKLRRALRTHRNHCTRCNYDLHGTPPAFPCPECGQTRNRR